MWTSWCACVVVCSQDFFINTGRDYLKTNSDSSFRFSSKKHTPVCLILISSTLLPNSLHTSHTGPVSPSNLMLLYLHRQGRMIGDDTLSYPRYLPSILTPCAEGSGVLTRSVFLTTAAQDGKDHHNLPQHSNHNGLGYLWGRAIHSERNGDTLLAGRGSVATPPLPPGDSQPPTRSCYMDMDNGRSPGDNMAALSAHTSTTNHTKTEGLEQGHTS